MSLKRFFNRVRLGKAVDRPGLEGETYLTRAVKIGDVKMVEEFLQLGADPDARNAHGEYPAHIALAMKNFNVLHVLLETGANIFTKQEGLTLSEHADKLGMTKVSQTLRDLEARKIAALQAAVVAMPMGIGVMPVTPAQPAGKPKPKPRPPRRKK